VGIASACVADAEGRSAEALRLARAVLGNAEALGIGSEGARWAWPLAARAAHQLDDRAALSELLTLLDACQPGEIAGVLSAERDLVRARLATGESDPHVTVTFVAAIEALRATSTPFHLAHGLLDYAEHLETVGDGAAAELATAESRDIAQRLGCLPLVDRADRLRGAPRVTA
jgi:hypothetical protein